MISLLLLFSLFILNCQAKNLVTVPLFVIESLDQRSELAIRLQSSREATFYRALERAAFQNHTLIFFIEPTLSMEDLSRKDSKGTSYYNLQNKLLDGNAIFFRNALKPYQYLVKHFPLTPFNRFDDDFLKNNISPELFDRSSKYFYVFFRDNTNGDDSRSEVLRSHDRILNNIYSAMRHMFIGPVTGIYTGMLNPVILDRPKPVRRTEPIEDMMKVVNKSERIYSCNTVDYCHAKLIVILSDGVSWHTTTDMGCTSGYYNKKDVSFLCSFKAEEYYDLKENIKHKIHCDFNFTYKELPKKWVLENIGNTCNFYGDVPTVADKAKSLAGGYVIFNKTIPNSHGYTSTAEFTYRHKYTEQWFSKSILYFQFSPTVKNLKENRVFNDEALLNYTEEVLKYKEKHVLFTAPIISGLLISSILVSIFISSLGMLMNIKVNTKFDDSLSGSWNLEVAE